MAPVFTKNFESRIVGQFPEDQRLEGTSSMEMFGRIKRAHYNVNVEPELRERQKLGAADGEG